MPSPTPTPEQQAAHDRLVAAYRELTAAGEAMLALLPDDDCRTDVVEMIADMLADFKPHELMDELGDAYLADQLWDALFEMGDDADEEGNHVPA